MDQLISHWRKKLILITLYLIETAQSVGVGLQGWAMLGSGVQHDWAVLHWRC